MSDVLSEEPLKRFAKKALKWMKKKGGSAPEPPASKPSTPKTVKSKPKPWVDPNTGKAYYVSPSGKLYPWDPKKAVAPKKKRPKKWTSAGGIVFPSMDDMEHVYIIKPSNNYGPWSFPKGRVDKGETMKQAAIREVWEETGIKAKILPGNSYVGKGEGSFSITHYYLMVQIGGHPRRTDETERVELVTFDEADKIFRRAGNKRDPKIIKLARRVIARYR